MHVIPRYSGDGINFNISGNSKLTELELEDLALRIKKRLET